MRFCPGTTRNSFAGITFAIDSHRFYNVELIFVFNICRIHYIKTSSKRQEKDILLLKARLDEYNDEWRTADTLDTATNNFPSLIRASAQNKSKKSTTRKYKKNADNANNSKNDGVTTNGSAKDSTSKATESKARKRQKAVPYEIRFV